MSWKKFSSNNSRKGAENNSKQKSSIYASKVFTDNIIVNKQSDVGEIDISNLNYTRDTYTSDTINILEFMHGTDISLSKIGVQNNVDTSGVVKIIKPIKGFVGLINKLKGYDSSFEKLNINKINLKNIDSIHDLTKIEIIDDVSFNHIVDFNDISMNYFNLNTNNELIISADISISRQDKSLKLKDASVNSLGSRSGTNIIRFDKDISLNGSIFSIGVSADELIVSNMFVNVIEAKDTSVNITNDISVNGNINIDKINLDFIVSDVSIQSDLSINGDLLCNTMKIDGNFGKFDNNTLEFIDTVSFENTLVKSDISSSSFTINTGNNKVPTNEIIPTNPNNIITYGLNSYKENSCIVIDGDVSINGKLDAMWEFTGMNIIPTLTSNIDLIKNIDDYKIGQLVILKIDNNEQIFIKSGEKSWHNLVMGNASPFFTKFELTSNYNNYDRIFLDASGIINDYSYTDLKGLEGTNVIFYVQKIYDSSNEIFTLDISHDHVDDEAIKFFIDNSFSSYEDGWGISLEHAPINSGTDISHVKILPPINNGFDFSFTVTIEVDLETTIPINQKVILKKINRKPEWNYMILSASNSELFLSDQSWNITSNPSINGSDDLSNQFYLYFDPCKNYVYSDGITDLSHYYLDLSALDPEGFDVSYDVSNVKDDLSWAWVDNSRIVIDISDTAVSGSDTSFQIISIDDWIDRPNPEERIVKFKHISSKVIKGFDISHEEVANKIHFEYNTHDNSYVIIGFETTTHQLTLSLENYYLTEYDLSINLKNTDNTIELTNNTDNTNIIDISLNKNSTEVDFELIFNNIFKYNFNITFNNLYKYTLFTDSNNEYISIAIPNNFNQDINIEQLTHYYGFDNYETTIYRFSRPGTGGNGGDADASNSNRQVPSGQDFHHDYASGNYMTQYNHLLKYIDDSIDEDIKKFVRSPAIDMSHGGMSSAYTGYSGIIGNNTIKPVITHPYPVQPNTSYTHSFLIWLPYANSTHAHAMTGYYSMSDIPEISYENTDLSYLPNPFDIRPSPSSNYLNVIGPYVRQHPGTNSLTNAEWHGYITYTNIRGGGGGAGGGSSIYDEVTYDNVKVKKITINQNDIIDISTNESLITLGGLTPIDGDHGQDGEMRQGKFYELIPSTGIAGTTRTHNGPGGSYDTNATEWLANQGGGYDGQGGQGGNDNNSGYWGKSMRFTNYRFRSIIPNRFQYDDGITWWIEDQEDYSFNVLYMPQYRTADVSSTDSDINSPKGGGQGGEGKEFDDTNVDQILITAMTKLNDSDSDIPEWDDMKGKLKGGNGGRGGPFTDSQTLDDLSVQDTLNPGGDTNETGNSPSVAVFNNAQNIGTDNTMLNGLMTYNDNEWSNFLDGSGGEAPAGPDHRLFIIIKKTN